MYSEDRAAHWTHNFCCWNISRGHTDKKVEQTEIEHLKADGSYSLVFLKRHKYRSLRSSLSSHWRRKSDLRRGGKKTKLLSVERKAMKRCLAAGTLAHKKLSSAADYQFFSQPVAGSCDSTREVCVDLPTLISQWAFTLTAKKKEKKNL